MPLPLRVLLIRPFGGARWASISAYARALADSAADRVLFDVAEAPWWNPPSLAEGVSRRWLRQPAVRRAHGGGYDLVHLTDHALGHHVRRFRRQPVVVTCHDLMPFTLPGYYRRRMEGVTKRAFLRHSIAGMLHADHIIAVSSYTATELMRRHGVAAHRLSIVPNMVRPVFGPRPGAEAALKSHGIVLPPPPRILSVGHAGAYKDLESLLRALARPELREASLVRVGGRLNGAQQHLAESLGVTRRVAELGRLPDEVLANVYSAANVLAQPSLAEGFGVPVIEALACGLPVVASDGGALREAVGTAGVCVPRADGKGFAARFAVALAAELSAPTDRALLFAQAARFAPAVILPKLLEAYAQARDARSGRT